MLNTRNFDYILIQKESNIMVIKTKKEIKIIYL